MHIEIDSNCVEALEQLKDDANNAFKRGDMEAAERMYLEVIEKSESFGTPSEVLPIYIAALNNLCATLIQLKKFHEAIKYSSTSIKLNDNNLKALYRRALACKELGEYNSAMEDVERILTVESANSQALALKKTLVDLRFKMNNDASKRAGVVRPKNEHSPASLATREDNGSCDDDDDDSVANCDAQSMKDSHPPPAALFSKKYHPSAVSEFNQFTVSDWKPTEDQTTGPKFNPVSLQAAAIPKSQAPSISTLIKRQQAGKNAGREIENKSELAPVATGTFDSMQEEEVRTKHVFVNRMSRNHKIASSKEKKESEKLSAKSKKIDKSKLHNQPDRYCSGAVDAWKDLESEEVSKTQYVKKLLDEKKKTERSRGAHSHISASGAEYKRKVPSDDELSDSS